MKSKPTWWNALGCSATSAFFVLGKLRVYNQRGGASQAEWFCRSRGKSRITRKGIKMKRFLALVLIAGLGVWTIGCESQKGKTENKTETTTSQTKDGKTTGETTTTVDTKTAITPAVPDSGNATTKKTTETTTETTK